MKELFDRTSIQCSKLVTKQYSTSFSLAIHFLNKGFHSSIYAIYGFVRLADEIVDSFHQYPKELLLAKFRADTKDAIEQKISLNPILNSFQQVVHRFGIDQELIDTFLDSMEMDLQKKAFNQKLYEQYILGSAEVVGLMCLRVFCTDNDVLYQHLKPSAMKLGAAFQKVNFLRDVKQDSEELGRNYFPEVDLKNFTAQQKSQIEQDIEQDFKVALEGIRELPKGAKKGVYLAYYYYYGLFKKIKNIEPNRIMQERIRIPNAQKIVLMVVSNLRCQLNCL